MPPILLTIDDACERLHVSRNTFARLVRSGEIPTVRFGRAVRVPLAALEHWIERHLQPSADDRP